MIYDSSGSGDGTERINSREKHDNNGCEKIFQIGSEEENEESCPAIQLGFDVILQLKAGINIASLVTVYGLAQLDVPFRINLPETKNSICPGADVQCGSNNSLQMSFAVGPLTLSFYIGVGFELGEAAGDLINKLKSYADNDNLDEAAAAIDFAIGPDPFLIAKFEILPWTKLGCVELKGLFSFINDYYHPKCCDSSSGQPLNADGPNTNNK